MRYLAVTGIMWAFGLALIVFAGAVSSAQVAVTSASHEAARAYTLERTDGEGHAAAQAVVSLALADEGRSCTDVSVSVDGSMTPGSTVSATVACTVDLGLFRIGAVRVSHTGSSVVDTYRSDA